MKTNLMLCCLAWCTLFACTEAKSPASEVLTPEATPDSSTPPLDTVAEQTTTVNEAPALTEEPIPTRASKPTNPPAKKAEPQKGAEAAASIWTEQDPDLMPDVARRIDPETYVAYRCDYDVLATQLSGEQVEVALPTSKGLLVFKLQNSNTMHPKLAAKFPEIRSYKGTSVDGTIRVRLDTNEDGLFAEFTATGYKELLSPILSGNNYYYALFKEAALPPNQRDNTYF